MGDGGEGALIGLIYQAAQSPALWQTVFDETRRLLGLHVAGAITTRFEAVAPPVVGLRALSGVPITVFASYRDYYMTRDPNLAITRHWAVGTVFGEPFGLSREAFRRSEIFIDFLRPNGADCPIGAVLGRNGSEVSEFLAYPPCGRQFNAEQVRALQVLVPHMCRSLQFEIEFAHGRLAHAIGTTAMNEAAKPLFIVDRTGYVHTCNALASELLDAHRTLLGLTAQGHLVIRDRDGQRRLAGAIQQTLRAADGASPAPIFQVEAHGDRISVMATPGSSYHPDGQGRLVSVSMNVMDRTAAPAPARLQQEFSLTPAEARVAADLAQGMTVEEIADKRGLKRDTVYTHVKHAREKTHTTSQAQLVATVLSGLAASRGSR